MQKRFELPHVRGKYRYNADLSKMCWFGTGGTADVLFIPADLNDLVLFLRNVDLPIHILGVGSNMLIRDGGVKGVLIRLGAGFNYVKHQNEVVTAGAATLDSNVAHFCLEHSLTNLEFLSGIPGTIGGALCMNAGAYNNDIANVMITTTAVNLKGEVKVFCKKDMNYGYRHNGLSEGWIFAEGQFQCKLGDKAEIANTMAQIQKNRESTQPIKTRTAGSTFKNPPGNAAWKLIDIAGCRGLRVGDVQVSELHCNFLINHGNATATDIESLICLVQHKVLEKTGIMLEPEIKIIGENDDAHYNRTYKRVL